MERLAHAVKALELIILVVAGHRLNHGGGEGVVGRELWKEDVDIVEKLPRTGEITHIGQHFAGEDGIAFKPHHLRALDFRIPVGALDEAHHDPPPGLAGKRRKPVEHMRRPALVSLHYDAKSVPSGKGRVAHQHFDDVQGKVEAIRLFRVDIKAHIGGFRLNGELADTPAKFCEHARLLGVFIARVKRRKLYGDSRIYRRILMS